MTYDEFDTMCEQFSEMSYKCGNWWPTMDEVKQLIEPSIKTSMEFAVWITETADPPQTDEEKEVRRYLIKLINNNLKLKEDGDAD